MVQVSKQLHILGGSGYIANEQNQPGLMNITHSLFFLFPLLLRSLPFLPFLLSARWGDGLRKPHTVANRGLVHQVESRYH